MKEATGAIITCRECGAECFWVRTSKGQMMLADAAPSDFGHWKLTHQIPTEKGKLWAVWYMKTPPRTPNLPLYTSHWATCPKRHDHPGRAPAEGEPRGD